MEYSILTRTKANILKCGVYFEPYDLFANFPDIENYKTKYIKLKPKTDGIEVYNVSTDRNILPAEILLSENERVSIAKLRYNENSPILLKVKNGTISIFDNGKPLALHVDLVKIYDVLKEKTPILAFGKETYINDFVDIVGVDRIMINIFDGCHNWTCGKACKFCDLHPVTKEARTIKPTLNNLKEYNFDIDLWWDSTKDYYYAGIKYSLQRLFEKINFPHKHLFLMAGNLQTSSQVWNITKELVTHMSEYIDFNEFDSYLNIAPHDTIENLKFVKEKGIKQVQYNLEIANKELFEDICPGKIKYDDFILKLKEAVHIFGKGNVRSNFVFGLQNTDQLIEEIDLLAKEGIVADYSVFQPKRHTPFENHPTPDFSEVMRFTENLAELYTKNHFYPIFCSLSSRSSLINEIFSDRIQLNN